MPTQQVDPLRADPGVVAGMQQSVAVAQMAADPVVNTAAVPPQYEAPASTIGIAAVVGLSAEQPGNDADEAGPDPDT